ncbi:PAS domain S-box protein [Pueribacillus theae]|uniref:PAS domain S-box protein n=1 Tax=Pueribacillus theae TaxID=2171751 RepID=A0A2U1K140_9BACI|nr:bifunctional diguanylate cyclase/phosphodiesterase [Pueribacillus theae]PWA11240.1 PAS domain S-box protein [Pueribacillus theae]
MKKEQLISRQITDIHQIDRLQTDKNLEEALKELADIKYALDQSSIVAITNQRGVILYVNEKFCNISKYEEHELLGQDHRILNSNCHSRDFFKNMWATIGKGKTWRGEIRNKAKDGSLYWVDTTIVPFLNEKGKPYQYISIRNDITLRKQMEEEIRQSEAMYRLITENSSDLISIIDKEGNFTYVSPSHINILKYEEFELTSSKLLDWIHEDDRENVSQKIQKVFKTRRRSAQLEFRIRKKNGKYMYVDTKVNSIFNEAREISSIVLVMRDITERKKIEKIIYHLAYHDALTDLPNRRLFMNELRDAVSQAKQSSSTIAVMFIDLDRFKYVNDSWGHDTGDYILTEAARRIRKSLRSNDTIGRLGGDEFAVLLREVKDKEDVERLTKRIQKKFEEPVEFSGQTYSLSCSIGIALFPDDGRKADDLLTKADTALYNVKDKGRSGYAFFHPEMEEKSLEQVLLENELRKAIELEQFHLDYQPKVDFSTGELVGMEALVRWDHPDLGRIPPNQFIPLAEETGLIVPLGEWVLRRGCEQNKEWQEKGHSPMRLAVNLSVKQLEHPGIVQTIKKVLQETKLDPNWLELEVTESIFADVEHAASLLQEIRNLGVHISIDDFGTGYSSFSYIKHLPVDTLKIDSSFIRDIHQNEESQAIVKAVLTLAKSLSINVIAEGIENKEQFNLLNEDGCQQGQGFLFSKPLSSQDFEKYLQNQ